MCEDLGAVFKEVEIKVDENIKEELFGITDDVDEFCCL